MTTIEWTNETWNPITGCKKVSEGCANCYAEALANRFWGDRKFTDVQFHPERLEQPLKWRKPRKVFVNSMSDWLHDSVTDEQIFQMLGVASVCREHVMQFLTKRPQRGLELLSSPGAQKEIYKWGCYWANEYPARKLIPWQWPLPNVMLGVTVENQRTADERIPLLLQTPAAVRFLSCEPLLEEIDLANAMPEVGGACFDWVIVGGESGPKARPCDIAWIRSIVEQCKAADVACFVKQLGSKPYLSSPNEFSDPSKSFRELKPKPHAAMWTGTVWTWGSTGKGSNPEEWPADLRVREFPKMPATV